MSMTRPFARPAAKHARTQPHIGAPREEISVVDDLRDVPEQDIAAPVPTFTPHELAATGAQPVLTEAVTAQQEPPADERAFLERVADGLRDLDFSALDQAQAVPGLTYAEAVGRKAGFAEGVVRGMLIAALWDAFRWYRDLDGEACDDCGEGWLCDAHIDYLALARTYENLHDFAVSALTDAAALERVTGAITAGNGQPRTPGISDLGSPGSPLAAVLESAIAAGGAR